MSTDATAAQAVHPCVRCGGPAENDFVDFWLCTQCYFVAGSTCAGIDVRGGSADEEVC